ncbi:MAG: Asp-tRNA(Asn)/Glu-tRNA(Gln) amidotransferase subunit GatA [Clostridiales Family XIII bacterium]|jgi:aspartyl-tRNA(Asn)/glutamyl-tRNA(Gln) amidotransferase subunit A|nr:Asp-tRNA(Asn)/Glu-tRNA(Gln) amidotransferase subunit GatA [Clostridiales Family XIII bacterium]
MEIRDLTALELGRLIREKKISSPEATKIFLDAAKEDAAKEATQKSKINAFISIDEEGALKRAAEVQRHIDAGEMLSPVSGVPVAVKDNICIQGGLTTAASRILSNFVPPYSATVIEKLEAAGSVVIGKTNLDEFAMGGSTETSFYGVTRNPWDTERVPGGSSGGSAAAVAAGFAAYAIGSDTGGSIRQPAAFCGMTGLKPTYGSVSRYGLLAYASSLDQIGPICRDARDSAVVYSILSGGDPKDSTSIAQEAYRPCGLVHDGEHDIESGLKGKKIGIPANYLSDGISEAVRSRIRTAADELRALGAEVVEFELPLIEYAVPAYYIIACAEASSNLSRYDGIKYGYRSKNASDILETYYLSRSEGFGTEVKRRIMLGSFVLSSGYFDAYYKKALQVRGLIKGAFDAAFAQYDMLLGPVSPTPAYKIGGQISDPIAMYMADVYTVSVNLTGVPAIALPCGFTEGVRGEGGGLPVGMQLIGKPQGEHEILTAAAAYQTVTSYHKRRPGEGV